MTINNSSTTAYTVESYKTIFLDVVITSNNPINTKYELLYSIASPYSLISDEHCPVSYFSDQDSSSGIIPANGTKRIRIRIFNNTGDIKRLTFQTKGSLINDNVELSQTQRHITRIASPYEEDILDGTDPVLSSNLIPVNIADNGTVTKASVYDNWYCYERQRWANAVVLFDRGTSYNDNDVIPSNAIQSYFVWIPRYKYQIFNTGNYTSLGTLSSTATQTINVVFENKNTAVSNGSSVNSWLTHPAFTTFNSNGFWVGKFESGYKGATSTTGAEQNNNNYANLIIKPNVYSWRNITVGNAFKVSYDYLRSDDSHMMKNTEWGAVAYLQHSSYGSRASVRVNNNSSFLTGYAAVSEPTCGVASTTTSCNTHGTASSVTKLYNTTTGYLASTTNNITGIYDMAGGAAEYIMGYNTSSTQIGGESGLTSLYSDFFTNSSWGKYYDKYNNISTTLYAFNYRIVGDATGEMGPFESKKDPDGSSRQRSSWYGDLGVNISNSRYWYTRGGTYHWGITAGIFAFNGNNASGGPNSNFGFRVVLTP